MEEAVEKKISWLISDSTITVNFNGKTHMLPRTDNYAQLLIKALKEKDYDAIPDLISAAARIEKFSHGHFQVRDGEILIDGQVAPTMLGKKIKEFADQGLPYEPLVKFAQKLRCNTSKRALDHLYQFLEANNIAITESGNIVCYKRVRSDFMDIYSGTFDNSVGNTVSMPRNQVNEDPNQTCSAGLHTCSWGYLAHYGGSNEPILEVEIDPKDVVAIPVDYQQMKMRVSSYKVLGVVEKERLEALRFDNENSVQEIDNDEDDNYECCDCLDCENDGDFCEVCENN